MRLGRLSCRVLLLGCAAGWAGCAVPQGMDRVDMPALKIVHAPQGPDALEVYDAELLWHRARDLQNGGAVRLAIDSYQRILREFPGSAWTQPARFQLAECHLAEGDGTRALAAIDAYLAGLSDDSPPRYRTHGQLRRGRALALLEAWDDAAALFDVLLVEELDDATHIEAGVDAGVCHFMRGDHVTAEYRLRRAYRRYRAADPVTQAQSRYFAGQALFYLAELERLSFQAMTLAATPHRSPARHAPAGSTSAGSTSEGPTPERPTTEALASEAATARAWQHPLEQALGEALERKCQALLRAQAAYTRTVREGHTGWAAAAGHQVGVLYESLHDELLGLSPPAELTASQRELYRRMLQQRVAILLEKALSVWQATAEMAIRTGEENPWVDKSRRGIERMKGWLLQAAATDSSAVPYPAASRRTERGDANRSSTGR